MANQQVIQIAVKSSHFCCQYHRLLELPVGIILPAAA